MSLSLKDASKRASERGTVKPKTILSNLGYSVRKEFLGREKLAELKARLTVTPKAHPDYPAPKSFTVAQEAKHYLRIPRYFGLQEFSIPERTKFQDNEIDPVRITFTGTLRESQVLAHDTVLDHLVNHPSAGGVLSLMTGAGKTFIALSLLSRLGVKTCILVHKSQLLQQWKKAIKVLLPDLVVGIVQQKKKDFSEDCDVHIVMIQTLMNIPSVPPIFSFTIVDEVHHLASTTFSQIMFKVNARFLLGLSATPTRKDGLTNILHWHLGPMIFSQVPDRSNQPKTHVLIYRFEPEEDDGLILDPRKDAEMVRTLCECTRRNEFILSVLDDLLDKDVDKKRRLLIMTGRVDHCKLLYNRLKKRDDGRTYGLAIGMMKQELRDSESEKMVIVSNYQYFSEGIDVPHLNTLVLASPKSDVSQCVGRIYRKVHTDLHPTIVDISDTWLYNKETKRRKIYHTETKGNLQVTFVKVTSKL
jgi:superfamily II DNA or RNA helicase